MQWESRIDKVFRVNLGQLIQRERAPHPRCGWAEPLLMILTSSGTTTPSSNAIPTSKGLGPFTWPRVRLG